MAAEGYAAALFTVACLQRRGTLNSSSRCLPATAACLLRAASLAAIITQHLPHGLTGNALATQQLPTPVHVLLDCRAVCWRQ